MKVLKQLLFAAAITICFSLSASAQKQDDKKNTPPKDNVPVILVPPKEPKEKPRENDRPRDDKKKPESAYLRSFNEEEETATA